ncbi:MAG: TetR/AcrR family transcriptional regulator [Bacteroidia bacterium]|nr:TetR/AcrR family transcriptional regulator [Bacteroidia bacterium]
MRERVIETAQQLFLQQGLRATTMDQVAESVGIAKKTHYEHVPAKEALIEACAETFLAQTERQIRQLQERHQQDALLAMIATANYTYQLLVKINPVLFAELRRLLPAVRTQIITRIQALIQTHLVQALQAGINQGIFRQNLSLDLIPLWWSYVVIHIILNPNFSQQAQRPIAEVYMETLLLFLYSFCTEQGRSLLETYKHHITHAYVR